MSSESSDDDVKLSDEVSKAKTFKNEAEISEQDRRPLEARVPRVQRSLAQRIAEADSRTEHGLNNVIDNLAELNLCPNNREDNIELDKIEFRKIYHNNTGLFSPTCCHTAFSTKPIRVAQKVRFRVVGTRNTSRQTCIFGFTSQSAETVSEDPESLISCHYPGYWKEKFVEKADFIFYYTNSNGDIHLGINNEDKGLYFAGINVRIPLWAFVKLPDSPSGAEVEYVNTEDMKRIQNRTSEILESEETSSIPSPLTFYETHGDGISISSCKTIAKRTDAGSCFVFSSRPVQINEKVYIRFREGSCESQGFPFGFTREDPAMQITLKHLNALFDIYDNNRYWTINLNERFCKKDNILFYYISSKGHVHFGINGEKHGILFSAVNANEQLWAIAGLQGNDISVQFVDLEVPVRNGCEPKNSCPSPSHLSIMDNVRVNAGSSDQHQILLSSDSGAPGITDVDSKIQSPFTSRNRNRRNAFVKIVEKRSSKDSAENSKITSTLPPLFSGTQDPIDKYFRKASNSTENIIQQVSTDKVKYSPVKAVDTVKKRGTLEAINVKYHCITCMKEYETSSLEELRLAAYSKLLKHKVDWKKWDNLSQRTGTDCVKYSPVAFTETVVGTTESILTKTHHINCMRAYEGKSCEELRLEDYAAGRYAYWNKPGDDSNDPFHQLRFHSVCGPNISLFRFKSIARTKSEPTKDEPGESFLFSDRPVRVNEKVCINLRRNLSPRIVSILFGFTIHDPEKLADSIQNYTFKDVINKSGNWIVKLNSHFCFGNNIISYYVNSSGHARFGINEEDKGMYFSVVDTKQPFWAFVELSVKCRDVELLHPRFFPFTTPLAPSSPNNVPPLSFHMIHPNNVRISPDGATATRFAGVEGIVFSARPVGVNERVNLRLKGLLKSTKLEEELICFGFSSHNPTSLHHLQESALNRKPGIWLKWIQGERFLKKDNILTYYLNAAGDVSVSINGEDIALYFSVIDPANPVWTVVNVRGRYTDVQFTDALGTICDLKESKIVPLSLHAIKGSNVIFGNDRGEANTYGKLQGYVFSAHPIPPRHTVTVKLLEIDDGLDDFTFSIGLTACNPDTLNPENLPDDDEELLDRNEYWVIQRDVGKGLGPRAEVAMTLFPGGKVLISGLLPNPTAEIFVDDTVPLWLFVHMGSTKKIRLFISKASETLISQYESGAASNSQPIQTPSRHHVTSTPSTSTSRPSSLFASSSTLFKNTLGFARNTPGPSGVSSKSTSKTSTDIPLLPYIPLLKPLPDLSFGLNRTIKIPPIRAPKPSISSPSTNEHSPSTNPSSSTSPQKSTPRNKDSEDSEKLCIICYLKSKDCVIYKCGHICMCYECARKQWKGEGNGRCPVCRKNITDIIRIFDS